MFGSFGEEELNIWIPGLRPLASDQWAEKSRLEMSEGNGLGPSRILKISRAPLVIIARAIHRAEIVLDTGSPHAAFIFSPSGCIS